MPRIAFVTTSYPRHEDDPSGHFVQTEARRRAGRGETVVVLAPGPGADTGDGNGGVRTLWLRGGEAFGSPGALARLRERPARAVAAAHFAIAARRTLTRLGPLDRIVAHWLVPSAFPIALGRAHARVPLEVVIHGTDVSVFERLPAVLRRRIASALAARGAAFRCVSEDLRERLGRAAPALLSSCRVEAAPIDLDGAPARAAARIRLGIAPEERLAVVACRLVPSKRPDVAVRLALSRGSSRVVLLGDGPLWDDVWSADPRVRSLGRRPRSETLAWIAASDLVVSASRREGAPTVVREARALGVPVLAVPAGDLRAWAAADPGIELIDA